MKNLLISLGCFCCLCVSGCTEKVSECDFLLSDAKNRLDLYSVDSSKLHFHQFTPCFKDPVFLKKASKKENIQAISRIMIIMKSYDSLDEILKRADWLNNYGKIILGYYVDFKRHEKSNPILADSVLQNALDYIELHNNKNDLDTSRLIDFYSFLSLKIGKEATLSRIDSLFGNEEGKQNVGWILKDAVLEFD